jgi:hypothetical protein
VDEGGTVHYTDSIPPSQVRRGHTELSEGGIRTKDVPPAKTPEQAEREQELGRLRAQLERLIEQQQAADRVLLRTFRSEDDLLMARDGKLAAIDVMIQVTRNNIRRQQQWLGGLQAEAANLERAGKPVPPHLKDSIASTNRSVQDANSAIGAREEQKRTIRESFDRDLKRFKQLHAAAEERQRYTPRNLRPMLYDIVRCANATECDRLWSLAIRRLRERAPLPVESENGNLLITEPPKEASDIRLILARIGNPKDDGAALFLELQCQVAPSGKRLCEEAAAKQILDAFRAAIAGKESAGEP